MVFGMYECLGYEYVDVLSLGKCLIEDEEYWVLFCLLWCVWLFVFIFVFLVCVIVLGVNLGVVCYCWCVVWVGYCVVKFVLFWLW